MECGTGSDSAGLPPGIPSNLTRYRIAAAPCSVLSLKPEGFRSPVLDATDAGRR